MRISDRPSAPRVQPSSTTGSRSTSNSTPKTGTNATATRYHADGMEPAQQGAASTPAAAPRLPVPTSQLRRGQTGPEVRQLQEALVAQGYLTQEAMNTGPGTYGPKTEAAVKQLQTRNGLPATGVYDAATQAALARELTPTTPGNPGIPPAGMKRGTEGAQVLQLQNTMVQLGYLTQQQVNTGPGMYGPQTEAAVKQLQSRNGLPTTGVYDAATQAALEKEVAQYQDPSQLVKATYERMLGREPTADELAAATARAEQTKQSGGSLKAMRQELSGAIRQTDEYRAAHPEGAVSNVEDANEHFVTQWGGTEYNSANGAPYGYNDCGPTSTVMALSMLGLMEPPEPGEASAAIDAVRDAAIGHDTTSSQRMGFGALKNAVEQYGGETQMLSGIDGIDEAIERGNPVIIGGNPWEAWGKDARAAGNYLNGRDPGGHFVTVMGKTPDGKYIIGDPLVKGGAIEVTREQLETFFRNGGFGAMEVSKP